MKFYSEPNMHIFKTVKSGIRKKRLLIAMFDNNGELETEDKSLIEKLKIHFKSNESEIDPKTEPVEEHKKEVPQTIKCNKCDKTFGNKGLLMQHYKKSHPKKGK